MCQEGTEEKTIEFSTTGKDVPGRDEKIESQTNGETASVTDYWRTRRRWGAGACRGRGNDEEQNKELSPWGCLWKNLHGENDFPGINY